MTQHDHDDLHDRGLAVDLSTLAARAAAPMRLERRGALKLLAGAAGGLVLIGCGSSGGSDSATTLGTSSSTTAGGAGSTSTAAAGSPTEAIPEETAGPFPGDGSNGPDVLTESGVVRRDIRSSFGQYSGTAGGVPLELALTVVAAGSGDPIDGAAVYLWHCDREGRYSLYSAGATEENYLRGVQAADSTGTLSFTSIFPGAYPGRWPHIHFEVYPSLDAATSVGNQLVTSQLALPEDACATAYATDGYDDSVRTLAQSSLERDGIFSDGYASQLATVTGDTSGMTATLTIAV
jgi:protocatechuate 3,4-dioxygenase beta subunit